MINPSQSTPDVQPVLSRSSRRLALKALAVAALTGVILIALALIGDTISSRESYREEATKSIAESFAANQTLVGPVLVRPFVVKTRKTEVSDKGVKRVVENVRTSSVWSFPHELNVDGVLVPSERRHGLYRVPVYELQTRIGGSVDVADAALEEGETVKDVTYGVPYFALAVSDVRGIVGSPVMTVNNLPVQIYQGVPAAAAWKPNLQVPLRVAPEGLHGRLAFALDLKLAGTEKLDVAPIGDSNHIELRSTWPSPLFAGRFLPHTMNVSPKGFQAVWEVSSLASATQEQMTKGNEHLDTLNVDMITPIDAYKLSDRASKYGILFVIVTFGGFFLFEVMKRLPIHPVQYFLVGLGLAIFFLLLISFSEHMAFRTAYLLASAGCIGLLTFYLTFVLRRVAYGLTFGALLALLYAGIYGLLISEDNALVLGSVMLFGLLAVVMFVTRKVDWYRGDGEPQGPPLPVAG
jgi:inner membrane protein